MIVIKSSVQKGLKMQPYRKYLLFYITTTLIVIVSGDKLLVTTGRPFDAARVTEILDLNNSSYDCPCVPHYPARLTNGVGAMFDNYVSFKEFGIVVCQGMDRNFINYGECWHLKNGTWLPWSCVHHYRRFLPGKLR